jgi:hypothetical protein
MLGELGARKLDFGRLHIRRKYCPLRATARDRPYLATSVRRAFAGANVKQSEVVLVVPSSILFLV